MELFAGKEQIKESKHSYYFEKLKFNGQVIRCKKMKPHFEVTFPQRVLKFFIFDKLGTKRKKKIHLLIMLNNSQCFFSEKYLKLGIICKEFKLLVSEKPISIDLIEALSEVPKSSSVQLQVSFTRVQYQPILFDTESLFTLLQA